MGMLFNTKDTVAILALANKTFRRGNLASLRAGNALINNINALTSANGLYPMVATVVGIDFPAGNRRTRWQAFLRFLDNQPDAVNGGTMAVQVGAAITRVLRDSTYKALEFFAVYVNDIAACTVNAANCIAVDESLRPELTLAVTIYTLDVDAGNAQMGGGALPDPDPTPDTAILGGTSTADSDDLLNSAGDDDSTLI